MEKKLKILHISTEKSWRGGEQQIAYLIENLPDDEVESIVFVLKNSAFHNYLKDKNFEFITYSLNSVYRLKNSRLLNQTVKKFKIDYIHAHTSKAHTLAFLRNCIFETSKVIVSRRVDFVPKMTLLSKMKYRHPSIVKYVCVSKAIEKIMQSVLKQSSKTCTVYSGIDLEKWKQPLSEDYLRNKYRIKVSHKVVGNIAAIEAHKDLSTFVKVANELRNEAYVFFIVGEGSLKKQISAQIKALKLDNVILTGFQKNIKQILLSFDIFLFTSNKEGLGTSLLDAMASKRPIVTTEAGGIGELVQHNKNGLTANRGNYKKLAQNIRLLSQKPELKQQIIENAAQKVKEFSAQKMAFNMLEIYKNIN